MDQVYFYKGGYGGGFDGYGGRGGMMYGGHDGFGILAHVFLFIALAIFIIAILRWARGNRRGWYRHDDALTILRERYAKGEIDTAEYHERKRSLYDC